MGGSTNRGQNRCEYERETDNVIQKRWEGGLGERGWAWVPVMISCAGLPVDLAGDGQIAASLPVACDACLPTNNCLPRGSLSHAHAQIP